MSVSLICNAEIIQRIVLSCVLSVHFHSLLLARKYSNEHDPLSLASFLGREKDKRKNSPVESSSEDPRPTFEYRHSCEDTRDPETLVAALVPLRSFASHLRPGGIPQKYQRPRCPKSKSPSHESAQVSTIRPDAPFATATAAKRVVEGFC